MGPLTALWNGLRKVAELILPVGNRAGPAHRSQGVRWALHVLVLVVALLILFALNHLLGIDRLIPLPSRFLRQAWLPILFLLMYALTWLGWWLWTLLFVDETVSSYPDIDAAWAAAMSTLAQANIHLSDLPLFLVLGRPEGPDDAPETDRAAKAEELLFSQAARLKFVVNQTPQDPQAPLHVYATREAVFLTCAGASLLGWQTAILAGDAEAPSSGTGTRTKNSPGTLAYFAAPATRLIHLVREIARKGGQATDRERRLMRQLERRGGLQSSLLQDTVGVATQTARLKYLCHLIARDRQPYCPLNGVLWLLPLAATDSDEEAETTALICAHDLEALRAVLKVHCPQFALVCDMEKTLGFREFIDRQTPDSRQQRVGQRFSMGTDLRGQPLADALAGSIHHLCTQVLGKWAHSLLRLPQMSEETVEVLLGNVRLCLLLGELHERDERLGRLLTKGIAAGTDGAPRFGGCYVAATGTDPAEQAFVTGVFEKMIATQNFVAWTKQARAEDERLSHWAQRGYGVLAAVGVALLALLLWSLLGQSEQP
ncbi:MAG TPA: type VI secretion protein IcmF/TssM N-terminal domain-containing protein [Gemmataceae bacterium]|nr:type VI secretion protein IcmF/TssM N-terminal domain-containing protein [Gemmataceae bacterium]